VKDATLFNVETILGWVTKTDSLCSALAAAGASTRNERLNARTQANR
jgi:hypothetical protein